MGRMRVSYMAATPDVRLHESVTALQADPESCFRMVANAGYDGIELMTRNPDRDCAESLERLMKTYRLAVPMLCTGEVYGQDRLSFMDPDVSVREAAVKRIEGIIDLAERIGAQVNVGRVRGRFYPDISRETSLSWMYRGLDLVCRHAGAGNVTVALEPIEYLDCNTVNTVQEAVEVIRRVGHPCFKLMVDLFQMQLEERSFSEGFRAAAPFLSHVHVCDSNRCAPGRGNFDFGEILGALKNAGYRGFVSLEVLQVPDAKEALERSIEVLRPFL